MRDNYFIPELFNWMGNNYKLSQASGNCLKLETSILKLFFFKNCHPASAGSHFNFYT